MIYQTLRLAEPLFRLLGRPGILVMESVLGLVLTGIAVQFVLNELHGDGIVPGAPP